MLLILNGDTTHPITFFLTSSTDHITGLTGATPTVTISKNGGAFAAPAGSISEIGNGWYKLTPSGADVTTNGAFLLHATATGADPSDIERQVVAFSPYSAQVTLAAAAHAVPAQHATTSDPMALLWAIYDVLVNSSQAGVTITAFQPDGATPSFTMTLDSATSPTSRKRAT